MYPFVLTFTVHCTMYTILKTNCEQCTEIVDCVFYTFIGFKNLLISPRPVLQRTDRFFNLWQVVNQHVIPVLPAQNVSTEREQNSMAFLAILELPTQKWYPRITIKEQYAMMEQ